MNRLTPLLRVFPCLLALMGSAAPVVRGADQPENWEGPLLKPVAREEVFEFTEKPTFRRAGKDLYEIRFTSKANCDVTVAIHDKDGRIVRYLVSGVLGPNAPEPLKKNSLQQALLWHGKNERGKYVDDPESCTARVSLGLHPRVEKLIGWHPKDMTGEVTGIGVDRDGVYVCDNTGRFQVKMYSHDGKYIRTIFPWPADKLNSGTRVPKTDRGLASYARSGGEVIGAPVGPPPGGERGPALGMNGSIYGIGEKEERAVIRSRMPVRNGLVVVATSGHRAWKKILLFGTDGSSRGRSVVGPTITRNRGEIEGFQEIEVDPQGVWLYGIFNSPRTRHAVYRLALVEKGPIGQPFIGEENDPKHAAKDDHRHLNTPMGLACDMQGRLYVSDYGNHRIQVFSPKGKHLKTIPQRHPRELYVHHKTGELYVHCYRSPGRDGKAAVSVVKFGPFENPKKLKEWRVSTSPHGGFCLDSYVDPARLWFATGRCNVRVFEEAGENLRLVRDFAQEVRKDGYAPHMLSNGYNEVLTALGDEYLYYGGKKGTGILRRVNVEDGKKFVPVGYPTSHLPWAYASQIPDETVAGKDGYMYLRWINKVGRFKPPTTPWKGGVRFSIADEVPFDYGEAITVSGGYRLLRGGLKVCSFGGANSFNMGVDGAPNGDVLVLCEIFHKFDRKAYWGGRWINEKVIADLNAQVGAEKYIARAIPGVLQSGQLVFI